MTDQTFSIDNDLFRASQHLEVNPIVKQMFDEMVSLGQTADLPEQLTWTLDSFIQIAREIRHQHDNARIADAPAVDMLRNIWQQMVGQLLKHGFEIEQS